MNATSSETTTPTGLRERQKALARDSILEAAADHIGEVGLAEFSMPAIAKRAGVSQRTVYNYFATRGELIDALLPWLERRYEARGGRERAESFDELPDVARANLRLFGEDLHLTRAFARVEADAADAVIRDRAERSERFQDLAERELPQLAPRHARNIGALIRIIVGSRTWDVLTAECGLTNDEAAETAVWGLEVLIEAARRLPAEGGEA